VQWQCEVRPPTLALRADPALLQQALGAVAVNAAEAALDVASRAVGRPASVAVRAEPCGEGRVMLAIEDSGGGIPATQREQVLVPFYTTKPAGSGIGLSLARQIVLSHGGRLGIDDSPLGGARISIELGMAGAADSVGAADEREPPQTLT
jgi:signal transduction histidine kinase